MESNESTGEQTLKLQWNQANAITQNSHTTQLLRSFYITNCKKIAKYDIKLPALQFAPSVMCPKCSSIWSESTFSMVSKPLQIRSRKAEKLVEKLNSHQKDLTRKQKKRAKWLKKKIYNNVVIKCEFCKNKTVQLLQRSKPKLKVEEKTSDIEVAVKKKKKKSKDKSAGLKLDKVIVQQTQPKKPLNQPNSKKANKPKVQVSKAKIEKSISKTQKQNSLLALAKMLKSQGSTSGTKSNNQLEKLLR